MKKLLVALCLILIISIGSVKVSEGADFQDGMWAYTMKDYATALRELKPFAEQGHPQAQYYVGAMYAFGNGVQKDHALPIRGPISLLRMNQRGKTIIGIVEKEMTHPK